ncbi:ABC transporter ATP-binding protein [Pontibacter mangrovi]|uniref:ABC transporter ATP-binding protein n=1 Tax=Pontibacter mangrovi TaxID=2589816 RepID=A0A501W676_9BACT|nr:ABC transporter ATP-binding protein [Pontibacter mangrovi]TPE44242.1 ABC transporter ATP-binding protein [Pontibacter mangrovi]
MIEIQELSFGYPGKPLLFQNLHLSLSQGHIYGLLGKNGAGKSTLLKNMVGLCFPRHGRCAIHGKSVSGRPVDLLEDLYFIPEEIYVPALTPQKFVSSTACFYPNFCEDSFYRYLQEFEVPQHAVLSKLSFGQQKKAIIAFGLAANTRLLVMDEPTNGLDIPSKVQFRKTIAAALTEERCIVISTHQVRDLDSLIDRLVVLHEQKIILNSSLDEIAEKLTFATLPDTAGKQVLYAEDSVRGKQVIMPNLQGTYSKVEIELLFNALISGNSSLLNHLKLTEYEQAF